MPALRVKRSVYVSRDAKANWPELTSFLQSIIEAYDDASNNWKYVAEKPRALHLKSDYLAVVSAAENRSEWETCPYAMVIADFLSYCKKVDESFTASGLCGK